MMKINLVAVGKIKERYFREGVDEYKKRLLKYCSFCEIEVREENFGDEKRALRAEAESILPRLKGEVYCLAVEGEKLSSEHLAKRIKKTLDAGGEMTFVIGSSNGLDESVKRAAKGLISFSDMTFPHTMARLMLSEQVYRAFTIIYGATYHK